MDESVVSVQGLIKRYGTITVVDNISFEVKKSEIFGLLGPNGAGKTTTLECLEGMCKSNGGTLCVNGCNPQLDRRKLHQTLGVQLQSSSLPDEIRPGEAMSLICSWHGLLPRFDLLRRFGIDYQNKKQYSEMSTDKNDDYTLHWLYPVTQLSSYLTSQLRVWTCKLERIFMMLFES